MSEQVNEQEERKAPIYLLVDTSGSMIGEPITSVKNGIDTCIQAVRTDPQSLEKAWVSIITFASKADLAMKLTKVKDIANLPDISAAGGTNYADAIKLLNDSLKNDLRENTETVKGDYKAFVVLFSDGEPNIGDYKAELTKLNRKKINYFIAATTSTDEKCKKALADVVQHEENVIYLPTSDTGTFKKFFKWVTQSYHSSVGKGDDIGNGSIGELPPLPDFNDEGELL